MSLEIYDLVEGPLGDIGYISTVTPTVNGNHYEVKFDKVGDGYQYSEGDLKFIGLNMSKKVKVGSNSGFHVGATGNIVFEEESGIGLGSEDPGFSGIPRGSVLVMRDGAEDSCWFWPNELYHVEDLDNVKPITDGGPSGYYDLVEGWHTLNDWIEYKSEYQWGKYSFHLANIVKALTRWGDKEGTTLEYDTKKIIYSGARVLKMIVGTEKLREYLERLLDDKQFK